tara:strand:+ start:174 stop:1352 length:1179 start_codon:yes stop_codon:yes gene_type:complete
VPEGKIIGVKYEYLCYMPISIYSLILISRNIDKYKNIKLMNLFTVLPFIIITLIQIILINKQTNLLYLAFSTFPLTYYTGFRVGKKMDTLSKQGLRRILYFISTFIILGLTILRKTSYSLESVSVGGYAYPRLRIGSFESNSYGIVCISLICLIVGTYIIYINNYSIKADLKFSIYVLLSFLTINIFFTFSRTSYLAIFTTFILSLICRLRKRFKIAYKKTWYILILILISISIFTIAYSKSYVLQLFLDTFNQRLINIIDSDRISEWGVEINNILASTENTLIGTGEFVVADNALISLSRTLGIIVGPTIYFIYITPLIRTIYLSISLARKAIISLKTTFLFILLPLSTIIFSLTGDLLGQSKSIPISFFTLGVINYLIEKNNNLKNYRIL